MPRILFALAVSLGLAFGDPPAPQLKKDYGRRPLAFDENRGQADPHDRFIARGDGYSVFITGEKAILSLTRGKTVSAVSMQVAGAKAHASPQPEERLQSYSNYFIGNDPSKWIQGVPHFGRIRMAGVRKGVDVVFYGNQRQIEYDLEIAPNANTSDLRLRFDGAQSLTVDRDGDLLIHTPAGDLREHAPIAWQEVAGEKRPVKVWQVARGRREVAFGIGKHNPSLPLVIDPIITYSTYLGGSNSDYPTAIAADSSGYAYVTGYTTSADFPVTSGFYHGTTDAFITKLNPSGSALIYSTYIGGSSTDNAAAIALDSSGNAYITGLTYSSDFPIVFSGGGSYVASPDAFVAKVDSSGVLAASRYLVGANSSGTGIAVDAVNNPYVVGTTGSAAFPTTMGSFLPTKPAGSYSTGFVAKLDGSLNVSYGTYLGGTNTDSPKAITIGPNGAAYITGTAYSANFPTTNGAFQTAFKGYADAFVAELNPQGSSLIYSTLLAGTSNDYATAIALDGAGNAYVT